MFSLIEKLFSCFDYINEGLENRILEVSIKHTQMVFCFEYMSSITISDLERVNNLSPLLSISRITTFQDIIFVHFENLEKTLALQSADTIKDVELKRRHQALFELFDLISHLRDILCTCPNLECVISENYIKVFIDVPNVTVSQVYKVNELLETDGMFELDSQRPYILYVKDW